jgi:hypothetical protein
MDILWPEALTAMEFAQRMEEHNASHPDEPGTHVNISAEEFSKSCRGEYSPLGDAMRAYYDRWHPR